MGHVLYVLTLQNNRFRREWNFVVVRYILAFPFRARASAACNKKRSFLLGGRHRLPQPAIVATVLLLPQPDAVVVSLVWDFFHDHYQQIASPLDQPARAGCIEQTGVKRRLAQSGIFKLRLLELGPEALVLPHQTSRNPLLVARYVRVGRSTTLGRGGRTSGSQQNRRFTAASRPTRWPSSRASGG